MRDASHVQASGRRSRRRSRSATGSPSGRITLGAGFGWYRPEFDAFSKWEETKERVAHSKEAIELMMRLWEDEEPLDFHGRFIHVEGAVVEPKTGPEAAPAHPMGRSSASVAEGRGVGTPTAGCR